MADKAISELVRASIITAADLFVLQQDNTAKCLPGQVLLNWLTAAADGHGGIADWEKIGTSGLVDTYRVTLADTTTFDYYVTNGKAISSVKQTSVSGLTRTYTIAFNDGTTQQFTVTDGRGILSVEQTSVSGLTRTYTISFNDGTTQSFEITDGRSFVRMEKTGTNGLVDTYTITCNDGSTETLTVTNGEKGDKGDRADIWVRYASQKPTESSHNFGELPDTWIGIATGHNMDAAPTDWQQYTWYQWKGDKGDTGEPAVRLSVTTAYQVGDAGNIIPSGSWLSSIPHVAPGKYLWIRKTTVWNKGDPDVDYSVSRMGLDGTGAVSTVAGVGPDANGNVPLTADNVKALPIGGGVMEGPINMNGQPISGLNTPTENSQAATKGYVDTNKVDKSKVVNEFNVTIEGFVADARALKVLNDSKLSMKLLWKNGQPDSAFPAQFVGVPEHDCKFYLVIAAVSGRTEVSIICPAVGTGLLNAVYGTAGPGSGGMMIKNRGFNAVRTGIDFGGCYYTSISASEWISIDNSLVPTHIYGLKGVAA